MSDDEFEEAPIEVQQANVNNQVNQANQYRLTPEQKQQYDAQPDDQKLSFLSPIINAKIAEEPFVDTPAYQERIQTIIETYLYNTKGNYTDIDVLTLLSMYGSVRENAEINNLEEQFRLSEIEQKKKMNAFIVELGRDGMKLREAKDNNIPMTNNMIEIALQRNGNAIQFVHIQRRTPEMIKIAIRTTPSSIRWIGRSNQTLEYAQLAYECALKDNDLAALQYIDEAFLAKAAELYETKNKVGQPAAQPAAQKESEK